MVSYNAGEAMTELNSTADETLVANHAGDTADCRGGNSRAGRTGGHQSSHPRAGVLEPTSGYGRSGSSLVGGKRRGEHSGDGRATQ